MFLRRLYAELIKPRPELHFIPFFGIIALFFRAQEYLTFGKVYHTVHFIATELLALNVIEDLNRTIHATTKRKKRKFTAPKIALAGTFALFVLLGINILTEIFYMGIVISWMHTAGAALNTSL